VQQIGRNAPTTISQALQRAVDNWGQRQFLEVSGQQYTYADVQRNAAHLALGLSQQGIRRGDRVCCQMDNSADFVFLIFAVAHLGAVLAPINTAFAGEFFRHQIDDAAAAVFVADAHYAGNLNDVLEDLHIRPLLVVKGTPQETFSEELRVERLEALYVGQGDFPAVEGAPGDLALLLYTSGTTGPSKGCMISQNYICNAAYRAVTYTGVKSDDIYWTPCPLFHMGALGVLFGVLQVGAQVSLVPRFSLTSFWSDIRRSSASVILILSSMLNFVADAADNDDSKAAFGLVRTVMGAPFPRALRDRWKERFGVKYCGTVGFGLTEANPIMIRNVEHEAPEGAVGKQYEDFQIKIVNDFGQQCENGVPGEILVRPNASNIMFHGYWKRPDATVEVLRDLWFHTGDIGKLDSDGYFYFVDRKKDYLRRGGENISSFEMEVALRRHPDIADVAVHAVLSELSEDEVKVTIVLKEGAIITEETFCRWTIDRLPRFAVPRFVEFRTELPRNAVGRVLKHQLRDEGVTPNTWDREVAGIALPKRKVASA
jgi:crotonobetaine/carnitine-CoA ligase